MVFTKENYRIIKVLAIDQVEFIYYIIGFELGHNKMR